MLNSMKKIALIGLLIYQASSPATELSAKEAYEYGHVVMQVKDWREAISSFEQAAKDQKLKSAAQYWQAYAHYQLKQKAQAKRLLERLIKSDPNSEWVDDAEVLLFEHGDGGEQTTHQAALDEELKLFTLQQIMFNKPEKALPKVYEMLEKSESVRVKMNALQLLGMSDQPQVVDYLVNFINREKNQDLQQQAIQMLSFRDSVKAREKLVQLYENSHDKELKAAIIHGFIHQADSKQMLAMLEKEQDPELSVYLIQMLGIKGDAAALKSIYKKSKGDQRRAILEALALSGDADYLYYVIDNESDPEIRLQAIHSLVMVNDENMGDYLANLYEKASSSEEKDVIATVFIATDVDPAVIVRLFKSDDNTERKHSLINTLMVLNAVDELKSLYGSETNPETKQAIIRQLGILDAGDELMEIYKNDPSVVNDDSYFHAMGMTSTPMDEDFLIERFKAGDSQAKASVLNALMMQDNVEVMLKILKAETNHEVKKQIIQMIGITDADALIDAIED